MPQTRTAAMPTSQALARPAVPQQARRRALATLMAGGACLAALGLTPPAHALGLGNPIEEDRAISGFQALAVEGSLDVQVALANQTSVHVKGSASQLALIQTLVENRQGLATLVLRWKPGANIPSSMSSVSLVVRGPEFKALSVAGSGDVAATLAQQPALSLSVAGSGDLKVRGLNTQELKISLAGSGDVQVQGSAKTLSLDMAGSGDASLAGLQVEDAHLNIAGSGDASVWVSQRLQASLVGSADVVVSGPVKDIRSSVAGSGTITRR